MTSVIRLTQPLTGFSDTRRMRTNWAEGRSGISITWV